MNIKNVNKKTLKGEYQLLFELVNKVLLPRSEKKTIVTGLNLFLMEVLSKYKKVPVIVIEHLNIVMTAKDEKHGLAYGFWLNRVFSYFNVVYGKGKVDSVKQMFNITTLEYNECFPRRGRGKSKSIVFELIDVQKGLREELDIISAMVAHNDADIAALKAASVKG